MRSLLIRTVLPFSCCLVPALAGLLIAVAVPADAQSFYLKHLSTMDWLIIALGAFILFVAQTMLAWRSPPPGGTKSRRLKKRPLAHEPCPGRGMVPVARLARYRGGHLANFQRH